MRNLSSKQRVVGGAVTILVLGVVALVYAAWTASGTGEGYAKATEADDLTTVDVSASTTATLYPGADGDVLIRIKNTNPYPVTVTAIGGNGAITADGGHLGCVTTGVSYTDQVVDIDVDANSESERTLDDAAHMSNASDNGCQGATFTIPVTLSGQSNA